MIGYRGSPGPKGLDGFPGESGERGPPGAKGGLGIPGWVLTQMQYFSIEIISSYLLDVNI